MMLVGVLERATAAPTRGEGVVETCEEGWWKGETMDDGGGGGERRWKVRQAVRKADVVAQSSEFAEAARDWTRDAILEGHYLTLP